MKKTLFIGLALGLVSLAATSSFGDSRPDEVINGPMPTQGCNGPSPDPTADLVYWDCAGQKNWGSHGIVGSSHDMTNVGGALSGGNFQNTGSMKTEILTGESVDNQKRICVYCHHPHNAVVAEGNDASGNPYNTSAPAYSPLWNRRTTASRSYTGYNNGIMMGDSAAANSSDKRHALNADSDAAGHTKIAGVSLLCMSCHDGVTAMSAYSQSNPDGATGSVLNGQGAAPTNALSPAATSSFEGDMNNHHPMGFKYQAVQDVDAEIAATSTIMVKSTNVQIQSLLYGEGADATMECVTCHDVHNTGNEPGAERFLWRSDNNSNFCLTCHLK